MAAMQARPNTLDCPITGNWHIYWRTQKWENLFPAFNSTDTDVAGVTTTASTIPGSYLI